MNPNEGSLPTGKTVLITGATGFLGSHVSKVFVRKGYEVLAYCRATSDFSKVSHFIDRIKWYDVADGYEKPFSNKGRVDSVIHLATKYGRDEHQSKEQVNTNLVFPSDLLELCREFGVPQFINTGSFITKAAGSYDYLQSYALTKIQFSQRARK